jgi:hypothetical protein
MTSSEPSRSTEMGWGTSRGITATEFIGDEENPAGAIAMFTLDDGLRLALYPRSELAKDAGVEQQVIAGSGVSLGHFVDSRADVDHILELAAWPARGCLAPRTSGRGESTPATSAIPTVTSGRSSTSRAGCAQRRHSVNRRAKRASPTVHASGWLSGAKPSSGEA